MSEEKYLMKKETVKVLGDKLHFHNPIIEAVDDPVLLLINKMVLDPLAEKIPEDILPTVQAALELVIDEMPTVEI